MASRGNQAVPGTGRFVKQRLLLAALVAGATLALYWPVTGFDFVNLDDNVYVVRHPHVPHGLTRQGVVWAFASVGYEGGWHPLTWLSLMLDVELFGVRPGLHHLTN